MLYTLSIEERINGIEARIDILQVGLQFVCEYRQRLVNVEFECLVDILLHSLRTGEILDNAEWLFRTKQPVGA